MDRLEALKLVTAQAARGELAFPTSVAAAQRIRSALEDADCHLATAARLIQAEPVLAARVVAMANSVAYTRAGKLTTDVASAVSRLGLQTVRTLAQALIVRQLAGAPTDAAQRELVGRLWEHTAHVASLSRLIARRVTRLDPDTALFAGLVHDVGSFYLLSRTRDFPVLLDGERREEQEEFEAAIDRAVVRTLSVPAPVVEALEIVWKGYLALPPVTLGDTVLLAKRLAPVASPLERAAGALPVGVHAASIDVALGEQTLRGILVEAAEEVDSLTRALMF